MLEEDSRLRCRKKIGKPGPWLNSLLGRRWIVVEGAKIKRLRAIPDQRSRLMEILRSDDGQFQKFGQVYGTSALPGVVKGWHYHRIQFHNLCPLTETVQVALYNSREGSPTYKEVNVFHGGVHNPVPIHVPPLVFQGVDNVGTEEALVLNCPTETYNHDQPDEYRVDPYDNGIPHEWRRGDGWGTKHFCRGQAHAGSVTALCMDSGKPRQVTVSYCSG